MHDNKAIRKTQDNFFIRIFSRELLCVTLRIALHFAVGGQKGNPFETAQERRRDKTTAPKLILALSEVAEG